MLPPNTPSKSLTLKDAIEILKLRKQGHFQNRIAAKFDVNPGRISEIVKGKRFPEAHKYVK